MRKTKGSPARELLANNLLRLRAERGLSQDELAHLADVHRTYMSSLERRRRNATIDVLYKIASALDLPFSALFEDSVDPETGKATPKS
ncbi:MAG: XRE family transcriptional regulator [Leifsonia xyli]|nr:MAG: XRE family transcriptional regulator [Leifsonia xyli]